MLFISVNLVQLAYTARFLRSRSRTLTSTIATSVEKTLLDLSKRDDVITPTLTLTHAPAPTFALTPTLTLVLTLQP